VLHNRPLGRALALAMLVASAGDAAAQRNVTLLSQDVTGSGPYREAVERWRKGQEPKIIGGKPARTGAHPWQVSLGVSWITDPYRAHFCGGSAYSATWVVTAAHCLVDLTPDKVAVTAGTNVLGVGGVRVNARRIIVKSDYNPETYDNDIALIELFTPLPLGERIRAIPLVTTQTEAELLRPTAPLIVLGWGATQEGGSAVRDLRYVDVPSVERAVCNRPLSYDGRVTANMLCAGVAAGGVDSCAGDSGGSLTAPATATAADARLAGIVSWGEGCARPNKYGVYTRVANFAGWVAACIAKPDECR
jgi:secreted trypsin-like serine protease